MNEVILYGKPGCHLCDEMKSVVLEVSGRRALKLQVKNILDDPEDYRLYRHDIPVLLVNGKEVARHRLTARALEASLAGGP